MKKFIFLICLLSLSFLGYSQISETKGISYQAVIIDPNPIELPGEDIQMQPYVNKEVWIKFSIYSENIIQFEEIHKTSTDQYGLVNLVIGKGTSTLNSNPIDYLSWEGITKSLVTSVSFDKGINFKEVSRQKLTSVPYSFYAVSAGKISGVLPIIQGGTGATTPLGARYNLGLGNIDNTSDLNKPVSLATQTVLEGKESLVNKSNDIIADSASTVKYPSVKVIKNYIDNVIKPLGLSNHSITSISADKLSHARNINGVPFDGTTDIIIPVGSTPNDATATTKGIIKLTGDLTGTADTPTIADSAIGTSKLEDASVTTNKLVNSSVTDDKIFSVTGAKVMGDISGNAATATLAEAASHAAKLTTARKINGVPFDGTTDITINSNTSNFSGTVSVLNGGTGANNPVDARSNLGLVIGTDVLAHRTFGTAANNNTSDFIGTNEKGSNNGVATLGVNGKIPSVQIPAISFQNVSVVNSDSAMIAITGAQVGSVAIRTDNNNNYVLSALPASILSNWIALATPIYVSTVNGFAGPNISLTTNNIPEGTSNKYFTAERARNSLSTNAPLNFDAVSGTLSMTAASTSSNGYLSAVDFARFNNKQSLLTAGIDYVAPNGNITGNAANVTGIVSIANGGTGTTTVSGALLNLGAESSSNKSNNILADASSITKFPTVKAIKEYVDQQTAGAVMLDNSITSAKINGTIAVEKGGTGASTASAARNNLGLGTLSTKSSILNSDVDQYAAIDFSKLNISKSNITTLGIQEQLTAGTGIAITSGIISAVGLSSSNLLSNAGITNSQLANSSTTLGSTTLTLGGNTTSLDGLTSINSTNFTGSLIGNASTSTKLTTARNINGVAFDGTSDITVTASASTLTGSTLATNVTNSSLTGVGTLTSGAIPYSLLIGTIPIWNQNTTGNAATATLAGNISATSNSTLTSIPNLTTIGTITTGVWSGTTIPISKGGTGLTNSGTSGQVLTSLDAGTLTWTEGGTHTVGETYGGGIIFYVYDNGRHGLIASTSDQAVSVLWWNGTYKLTYANRNGINAGIANTERIVISQGNGSNAASLCSTFTGGNFGDWYLPSLFELNLLFTNRSIVGGFANSRYWSSTEIDSMSVWTLNLVTGSLQNLTKGVVANVRAIRAF